MILRGYQNPLCCTRRADQSFGLAMLFQGIIDSFGHQPQRHLTENAKVAPEG